MKPLQSLALTVVVAVLVSLAVAFAGGDGAVEAADLPLTVWVVVIAFGVNWIVFVPSWLLRSERFYDTTGSLTYLSVVVYLLIAGERSTRSVLLAVLVAVWAVRLGAFLTARIIADGRDVRFSKLTEDKWLLLRTWTLQGLWVSLTLACAAAVMSDAESSDIGVLGIVGAAV